jgi:hypothetical protein
VTDPREIVAAEYGLSPEAAKFLQGETLEEVEGSAATLVQLLGEHRDEQPAQALDPITAGMRAKAERKAELHALFTGRTPQPRDDQGRFSTSGFDGGARKPVPPPRDPEREHNEMVMQMAALSRTFGTSLSSTLGTRF